MDTFYSMIEHSLYPKGDDVVPTHLIMWAGHYSYQNDPTECELYFKGLKKAIQDYSNKASINLIDEYNKYIGETNNGLRIYFISFSEQEDDLTMWRGYGQNGDGISLGFDFTKLPGAPLIPICDKNNPDANWRQRDERLIYNRDTPIKCIYTEPNNIKIEDEVCTNIIKILQEEEDKEFKDIILRLRNNKEAPKYKHIKYAAEKEYRIIKTKIIPNYRMGRNGLPVPYIEEGIPLNCLKKIIIGPCQASSEAATKIKRFLWSKRIETDNIDIITSQIPYRNRI